MSSYVNELIGHALELGDEERQVGLCVGGRAEGVGLVDRGRVVHGGGTEEGVVG